jgi:hypothetical protein
MSEERILAIIPNVQYSGKRGVNHYIIYVTTRKLYFIQTKKGYDFVQPLFLGLYFEAKDKNRYDGLNQHELTDISSIVNHKNFVRSISLKRITEIRFIREIGIYRFIILGHNKKGKIQKLVNGFLIPPQQRIEKAKELGFKKRRIFDDYALEVEYAIESIFLDKVTHKFNIPVE